MARGFGKRSFFSLAARGTVRTKLKEQRISKREKVDEDAFKTAFVKQIDVNSAVYKLLTKSTYMPVAANVSAANAAKIRLRWFINLNNMQCANQNRANFTHSPSAVYEIFDKKLARLPSAEMAKTIVEEEAPPLLSPLIKERFRALFYQGR